MKQSKAEKGNCMTKKRWAYVALAFLTIAPLTTVGGDSEDSDISDLEKYVVVK